MSQSDSISTGEASQNPNEISEQELRKLEKEASLSSETRANGSRNCRNGVPDKNSKTYTKKEWLFFIVWMLVAIFLSVCLNLIITYFFGNKVYTCSVENSFGGTISIYDELKKHIDKLDERITYTDNTVTALEDRVTGLINTNSKSIAALSSQVAATEANITTLQSRTGNIEMNITNLYSRTSYTK